MQCVHVCICIFSGRNGTNMAIAVAVAMTANVFHLASAFDLLQCSVSSERDFKFAFYREIELKEKLNIIKKGKKRNSEIASSNLLMGCMMCCALNPYVPTFHSILPVALRF